MSAAARSLLSDELDGVVSALCARFPSRRRSEIQRVVTAVYDQLAGKATITAHLIPLTLNRSRRVLDAMQKTTEIDKHQAGHHDDPTGDTCDAHVRDGKLVSAVRHNPGPARN